MAGNQDARFKRSIDIDIRHALMLAKAMQLAANTAMFTSNPDAELLLRQYQATFDALVPEGARVFGGNAWAEIAEAIDDAASYRVEIDSSLTSGRWYSNPEGSIRITVGAKSWKTKEWRYTANGAEIDAVRALLAEMAPLDCKEEKPEAA